MKDFQGKTLYGEIKKLIRIYRIGNLLVLVNVAKNYSIHQSLVFIFPESYNLQNRVTQITWTVNSLEFSSTLKDSGINLES